MNFKTTFAASAGIMLAAAALCGCKGRTAENMTPDGDTVEVLIPRQTEFNDVDSSHRSEAATPEEANLDATGTPEAHGF